MHHKLKIWPRYFEAVQRGDKPFEVRKNDRSFAVGDTLELEEWEPTGLVKAQREGGGFDWSKEGHYTGRKTEKVVVYIMHGGQFGVDPDFVVMGIR